MSDATQGAFHLDAEFRTLLCMVRSERPPFLEQAAAASSAQIQGRFGNPTNQRKNGAPTVKMDVGVFLGPIG